MFTYIYMVSGVYIPANEVESILAVALQFICTSVTESCKIVLTLCEHFLQDCIQGVYKLCIWNDCNTAVTWFYHTIP